MKKTAAIIGLGFQGLRHYQALKELDVELVCVVDLNPEGVYKKVPEYPKECVSSDADAILSKYKPETVIIATNASARIEHIRRCIRLGIKKIFCEKPMATTLKDAIEISELAQKHGCLITINHLRRWNPNYFELKKMIDSGVIGKVEHLYAQTGSVGLGNEGTHIIDKMRMVTGSEVDWVAGFTDKTGTPNVRGPQYKDPAGWGMLKFKDGTRAFLDTCEDTGVPPVFEIVGTHGRIIIEELNNHWTVLARAEADRTVPLTKLPTPVHPVSFPPTLPWDVKEFTKNGLKELIFENRSSCTAQDGCRAIEPIFAFHVSDKQEGARVSLPLNKEYHSLEVNWA